MLPLKFRLKILNKLAQTVPGAPASPASPTAPTAPTEPESTTEAVIQPPPSFTAASGPWAWLTQSYNGPTVGYLSTILGLIHTVMHYTTEGKHNLVRDQGGLGNLDASGAPSTDGKNSIKLAQIIYKTFLNNGQAFTPTTADIHRWASMVENSPPLIEMSQINPTGPAARQMQLPTSFRQTIVNNLGYIKQYNPLQPQKPQ